VKAREERHGVHMQTGSNGLDKCSWRAVGWTEPRTFFFIFI